LFTRELHHKLTPHLAYQTFIDLLTNHSKSTNSAFLQVYTSLSEAPDPYPLLEASVDSLLLSEDTLPKLTSENEHLQKTVTKLTTQLEETESRLEDEQTTRKKLEENLESKVKEVESSWAAVLEEKKDNWDAKEKSLEEKIENQDRLLKEIKASYEVTQRLNRAEGDTDGHHGTVTSAELEMVTADLERTSARLAEVEVRNEQMRIELAQAVSQKPQQPAVALEDDPAFMRLRSENSSLLRKLDAARIERDAKKRDLDNKLRTLEREIQGLKDERDALRAKVQKWSDYDEVKQELEVLKSIEFSTGDDGDTPTTDTSDTPKGKADTLEELLLARNKKLGDELTILRVSHQDLQQRLEGLQEELSRTNAEVEKLQNLNAALENDLANVQSESANAFPSGASVAGSRHPQVAAAPARSVYGSLRHAPSPTSSIISGFDSRSPYGSELPASGGSSAILPMITAQRDRFKKRNAELENQLSESHRTVSGLRQEIASLQKDNLNLYEKTRYVSSYNRSTGTAAGGGQMASGQAYASNPNPSTISIGGGPSTQDRYRSAYESNISPFAAFRGRESARAYKRMSLPERIVFSITRMVLATRTSRNLFAAYCVALHVLVFISLYWVAGRDVGAASVVAMSGGSMSAGMGGAGVAGGSDSGKWVAEADPGIGDG
jgi:homeobox protein cut-like